MAIVNAAMGRRHWQHADVVGERFYVGGLDTEPYEIVGVVADYKVRTVGEEPRPMVHFARSQRSSSYAHVLARTAGGDARQVRTPPPRAPGPLRRRRSDRGPLLSGSIKSYPSGWSPEPPERVVLDLRFSFILSDTP